MVTSGRDRGPSAGGAGVEGIVAIVTALPEELDPLLARVDGIRRVGAASPPAWEGRLGGRPIVLASTGDGAARAARGLSSLLEAVPAAAWIGAGFAGGLSPELPVGTVLVAREIRDGEGRLHRLSGGWTERALAGGGAVPGLLFAAGRILASAADKARTRAELPAGAWAADLESLAWMRSAPPALPGLIVRVISDSAEEELPAFLPLCSGEDGAINRRRVALHALRHPSAIGKLLAMRRRARFCAERLADYLEGLAGRAFADPA